MFHGEDCNPIPKLASSMFDRTLLRGDSLPHEELRPKTASNMDARLNLRTIDTLAWSSGPNVPQEGKVCRNSAHILYMAQPAT